MKTLTRHLKWLHRPDNVPTTPDSRGVSQLVYVAEHTSECGRVNQTATGKYWWFTMNPLITCAKPDVYLIEHDTRAEAEAALYNHVLKELIRVMRLESETPYTITRRFKERDRDAFTKYSKTARSSDDTLGHIFKCGMEWILRSEGTERRPSWAQYLVQNRNGVQVWFENRPTANQQTGFWEAEGRSQEVKLHDSWWSAIRKLT